MAKLTLSFKDRKLKVFALDAGDCLIGRDPQCAVVIDSLAIEPEHARIHTDGDTCTIEAANEQCAVSVNNEDLSGAQTLEDGDLIRIGKHSLSFSAESESTPIETRVTRLPSVGWIQIQNGTHLGRIIRLDKAFTRVGKPDGDLAVIAHRDDGYYLSALQGDDAPRVNDQSIGEASRKLDNGDHISIGELKVQFFADSHAARDSDTPPTEQDEGRQRRFSRIPFNVSATLMNDAGTWETRLLDVSLHGALIKAPASFESTPEQLYRLAIHLEGGPDICMDVAIAHSENEELGLHCKDIDVESITHLRRLVELNLGDQELLERELSALG